MPECPDCGYPKLDDVTDKEDDEFDYLCVNCGELYREEEVGIDA